jgi:hypothetical protein
MRLAVLTEAISWRRPDSGNRRAFNPGGVAIRPGRT